MDRLSPPISKDQAKLHTIFKVLISLSFLGIVTILVLQFQSRDVVQLVLRQTLFITPNIELSKWDEFRVQPYRHSSAAPVSLPNLSALGWPVAPVAQSPAGRRTPNGTRVPLPPVFDPVMSIAQRNLSKRLLQVFSETMFANGLGDRFMLYGGTLIGSYRHHDFIPWDDDIDVLVDILVRDKVRALLSKLHPEYNFYQGYPRDKFFAPFIADAEQELDVEKSRPAANWGWPFLDISYFKVNGTHVMDITGSYGRFYEWTYETVFPLHFRPLGQYWYPAPRDTWLFNRLSYKPGSMCVMPGYSHVQETSGPSGSIPCRDLASRYAFVEHSACINVTGAHRVNKFGMVLAEERLVLWDTSGTKHVLHSLCLAVLKDRVNAESFAI